VADDIIAGVQSCEVVPAVGLARAAEAGASLQLVPLDVRLARCAAVPLRHDVQTVVVRESPGQPGGEA
jgi:hypothetical protein